MSVLLTEQCAAGVDDLLGCGGCRPLSVHRTVYRRRRDRAMVDEALALVGGRTCRPRFSCISDGQRQRAAYRAICQEPEVIVLDEPTSFLDIRYKLELLTVLKAAGARKAGIRHSRCTDDRRRRSTGSSAFTTAELSAAAARRSRYSPATTSALRPTPSAAPATAVRQSEPSG